MAPTAPTRPALPPESGRNGLFSTSPSPRSVRPLVGTLLLAMVEAGLVLATPQVAQLLKIGAAGLLLLSALVIVVAGRDERRHRKAQR